MAKIVIMRITIILIIMMIIVSTNFLLNGLGLGTDLIMLKIVMMTIMITTTFVSTGCLLKSLVRDITREDSSTSMPGGTYRIHLLVFRKRFYGDNIVIVTIELRTSLCYNQQC